MKNQEVYLPNSIKKIKAVRSRQEFYMEFVKHIKPLLMFVHHLDLYTLRLKLLITSCKIFNFSSITFNDLTVKDSFVLINEMLHEDNKLPWAASMFTDSTQGS